MTVIIGIDPSLSSTGWGVIAYEGNNFTYIASGSVKTNANESLPCRIKHLFNEVAKIINQYLPQVSAIEEVFVNKNSLSSLKLGHARGAILLALSLHNLPIAEYATKYVKKALVGNGSAEKEQVASMVKLFLPKVKFQNNDESDALAVAICHANSTNMSNKLKVIAQ